VAPSIFTSTPGACGGPVNRNMDSDRCMAERLLQFLITVSPAALLTMIQRLLIGAVDWWWIVHRANYQSRNGLSGGCGTSGTSNPSTFTSTPGACGGPVTETWTATDACGRGFSFKNNNSKLLQHYFNDDSDFHHRRPLHPPPNH